MQVESGTFRVFRILLMYEEGAVIWQGLCFQRYSGIALGRLELV